MTEPVSVIFNLHFIYSGNNLVLFVHTLVEIKMFVYKIQNYKKRMISILAPLSFHYCVGQGFPTREM
jgi:hypothetical protein